MDNHTTIDRIMLMVERGDYQEAEDLAKLADFLEECYSFDVEFD